MQTLLITGAYGQLGSDLRRVGVERNIQLVAFGSKELDITDGPAVRSAVSEFAAAHPAGVVVNAAAYTAVDKAESDVEAAYSVNRDGPTHLAQAAAEHGLRFIHVSTDYVFSGDATIPYEPTDPTGPRSVYGASKLAGEQAVRRVCPDAVVVRTAWVYGATGGNFVKTMCALEASRDTVSVVDDQTGSPSYARHLAVGLAELAASDLTGEVLHLTNTGETTWHGFTRAIFQQLGADPSRVLPTTTAAFPRPAPRPAYSVLSSRAWVSAGLTPLPDWQEALQEAMSRDSAAYRPSPAQSR